MIGLVRILAPTDDSAGTESLRALPRIPASKYAGFFVRCDTRTLVEETVDWWSSLRRDRPEIPLGMVAHPRDCAALLATCSASLASLLQPTELRAGALPNEALNKLREASVEGQILEGLVSEHGPGILHYDATLKPLIARAVRGAARDLGVAPDTVRRRLRDVGLSAGRLVRETRVEAYRVRVSLGLSKDTALVCCGWHSHKDRRRVARRLRTGQ